jgi:t-SNARE complex subunit (syntaxin)
VRGGLETASKAVSDHRSYALHLIDIMNRALSYGASTLGNLYVVVVIVIAIVVVVVAAAVVVVVVKGKGFP